MNKSFLFFLLLILPFSLLSAQDLVILHTNDIHSQLDPHTFGRDAGYGGVESLSGYMEQVRQEQAQVLFLDAGDYNQGTPYFNIYKGALEVELMNAMGLDATTLGNHEFDNGVEDLANRLSKARYTSLCANYDILYKPLQRLVKPYVIFKKGPYKIGVIGVTVSLRSLASGEVNKMMIYHEPAPIVNQLAKKLKDSGCDMVICLSHLGLNNDLTLVKATRNVDLVIGGHSHTFMIKEPAIAENLDGEPVKIVQTGAKGVYVGRVDVTF